MKQQMTENTTCDERIPKGGGGLLHFVLSLTFIKVKPNRRA